MSEDLQWSPESMLEVKLKAPDDFLKVRETLTRIGVASRKEKVGKKQLERFARLTADKYGDTFTLVEDATVIGNEPGVYMVEDKIFRVDENGQAKQIV